MPKYKSITQWRDLEDNHLYRNGEEYPHDGREVSEARIATLMSPQNKAGFAVIEAVEVPEVKEPVEEAKPPKKPVKTRKKAT